MNAPLPNVTAAPPAGPERSLLEAAERALRAPHGKMAVALHLSRLRPPAPRPHHTRIARALLQDSAQRYGGQVFPLRNGDLVLLCAAPGEEHRLVSGQSAPTSLPAALARLFGADAPNDERLTTAWRLDAEGDRFWQFLHQHRDGPMQSPSADETGFGIADLLPLDARLAAAQVTDLLAQQTAIQLRPGRDLPLTGRLAPLFRELTFSLEAVTDGVESGGALGDPYLFRHFAARLDVRMLEHVHADLEQGGKLTRGTLRQNLPLHLNLTLEGIVSQEFARLADSARRTGARFGVEVPLMEAAADPAMMEYARRLLDMAGFPLIIDGLDHVGLTMTHPAVLLPSLVKLTWSPRLADAPPPAQAAIDAAIARIGPERLILQHAESEAALVWGQSHGIKRYQGFFLDAVQAAARIGVCHSARACTLRQCIARAASFSPTVRTGCGNPGLLDIGPTQHPAEPAITQANNTQTLPHALHASH